MQLSVLLHDRNDKKRLSRVIKVTRSRTRSRIRRIRFAGTRLKEFTWQFEKEDKR